MKSIYGIVAEYNPFHLGHLEQISLLRGEHKADIIIAIMSGHFLQRGIPSIMDKWTRAKIAVDCGVDLVVELPFLFSCASSDDFAEGAVKLLSYIGVNHLSFGVEEKNIENLYKYMEIIENNPQYDISISEYLSEGYSYVKANELALSHIMKEEVYIGSNALLGLSYLRAIYKYNLQMRSIPIKRLGADYHDDDISKNYPSAMAIRNTLSKALIDWEKLEKSMPKPSFEELNTYSRYIYEDDFYKQIVSAIFLLGRDGLKEIRGVKEGLENRIFEAALRSKNLEELIDYATSKRYTSSSIRRILFNSLMGVKKDFDLHNAKELEYHRILAMSKNGRKYISSLRKNESFKPIVNFARDIKKYQLKEENFLYDIKATAIYSTECESIKANSDYLLKPYIEA